MKGSLMNAWETEENREYLCEDSRFADHDLN
jgi:hypothetical protein